MYSSINPWPTPLKTVVSHLWSTLQITQWTTLHRAKQPYIIKLRHTTTPNNLCSSSNNSQHKHTTTSSNLPPQTAISSINFNSFQHFHRVSFIDLQTRKISAGEGLRYLVGETLCSESCSSRIFVCYGKVQHCNSSFGNVSNWVFFGVVSSTILNVYLIFDYKLHSSSLRMC